MRNGGDESSMSCGIVTLGSAAFIHYLLLILIRMPECLLLSFTKCGMLFLDFVISVMYACHDAGQDNCLETHIAHLGQTEENSLSACSITLVQDSELYYFLGGVPGFSSSNYCTKIFIFSPLVGVAMCS